MYPSCLNADSRHPWPSPFRGGRRLSKLTFLPIFGGVCRGRAPVSARMDNQGSCLYCLPCLRLAKNSITVGTKIFWSTKMTDAVLFEPLKGKSGQIGLITLNRPNALNALNWEMCKAIQKKLHEWEEDPQTKAVVIKGAGEKAFCAGGDVRHVYALGRDHHYQDIMAFFRDEYALNYQISQYSKPYIAFMDGITMGGGAGLSVHAKFRIGTERLIMAMPETGIGFFPDIGATYFLPRCSYEIGTYLGLSGDKIDAADALYAQLIDYFIPSFHLDDVLNTLLKTDFDDKGFDQVEWILGRFAVKTEPSSLYQHRETIQTCFSHDTVEAIIMALKTQKNSWHGQLVAALKQKSPLSLKVTLEALRRGLAYDFPHCQTMEIQLCEHFVKGNDFYEGVRALLIDKDKTPHWKPATLDKVSNEDVLAYFESEK